MQYVFEVKRNRFSVTQGTATVLINGEAIITFNDDIVMVKKGQNHFGELIDGWGSITPDENFIKGLLFHPSDRYYRYSHRVKAKLSKEMTKDEKNSCGPIEFCKMCFNATVDPTLRGKNDLSYSSIGMTETDYFIYMRSGGGQLTEILFEDKKTKQQSHLVGRYVPNFCPNCGRMLKENNKQQ